MNIFFYLFAGLLLFSSFFVIASRNPVYSVLWLIFAFCNGAGLLVLIGAEFLAMMLIIIYVGAVSVLFLFVIMMLDIELEQIKRTIKSNIFLAVFVAFIMFLDLLFVILLSAKSIHLKNIPASVTVSLSNTHLIGKVLYTEFILPFQTAGIILFVAMISCIVLTLRKRDGVKKQDRNRQLSQNKTNVSLLKVKSNAGLEGLRYDE